jgi:hypothetical protein
MKEHLAGLDFLAGYLAGLAKNDDDAPFDITLINAKRDLDAVRETIRFTPPDATVASPAPPAPKPAPDFVETGDVVYDVKAIGNYFRDPRTVHETKQGSFVPCPADGAQGLGVLQSAVQRAIAEAEPDADDVGFGDHLQPNDFEL